MDEAIYEADTASVSFYRGACGMGEACLGALSCFELERAGGERPDNPRKPFLPRAYGYIDRYVACTQRQGDSETKDLRCWQQLSSCPQ